MFKHIEINCFEFEEYSLKNRKRIIKKQMEQYINLLSIVINNLEENRFQVDFIINDGIGEELEIEFNVDSKTDLKEEFLKKYEEVIKDFSIDTNKITFKIYRKVL